MGILDWFRRAPEPSPSEDNGQLHIWTSETAGTMIARSAADASQLIRDTEGCDACELRCAAFPSKCPGARAEDWTLWPDDTAFELYEETEQPRGPIRISNVHTTGDIALSISTVTKNGAHYIVKRTKASPSWWVQNRPRGLLQHPEDREEV